MTILFHNSMADCLKAGITDINTVIMEFSYIVAVREFSPGGTLKVFEW